MSFNKIFIERQSLINKKWEIDKQIFEIENKIVKEFCPFKVGQTISITYKGKKNIYYGIISIIHYREKGYDNKWRISYNRIGSNLKPMQKRYNGCVADCEAKDIKIIY